MRARPIRPRAPSAPWLVAVAFAAALSGCGSSTPAQPIGFLEPSGVAVFQGLTSKYGDVHPYVAVLNAGRSDLTLLDAVDDTPVLAPVVIKSLAVPVPVVRPSMIVASTLADGTDAAPTPDLLVIAAPGSTVLQLVATWSASPHVVDDATHRVDLASVAPGAQLLALLSVPPLDPATGARSAGKARLVAALTGGKLAVVDYARTADAGGLAIAPVPGGVALQPLVAAAGPFDAVSLAVNPAIPSHLYAASPDPLGIGADGRPLEGVADITMAGLPGSWTIQGMDARAPTTAVAAVSLKERLPDSAADDATAFQPLTVDRVYAVLDPSRCGPRDRVPCGIAVLDATTHRMRGDYTAGVPMPYLAPILVPGVPLALAISLPPRNPPSSGETQYSAATGLMKIAPPSGVRGTTAVMAVGSSDGRVYFVDLGRWSIPNSSSILRSTSRTLVSSAGANTISPTYTGGSTRQLALWQTSATGVATLLKTGLEAAITVTPGFTTSETWTVSYQGPLPGLELHKGDTGRTTGGSTWVALQVRMAAAAGGQALTQVVKVIDPALGIHVGDVVRILANDVGVPACVDPTPADSGGVAAAEATVADVLAPTTAYPGGAIVLAPTLTDPRYDPADPAKAGIGYDWPACIAALGAGVSGVPVEIRASDFVVVGASTGYAGRAIVQYAAPGTPSYALQYEDEDLITGALPPAGCPDPNACTDLTCRPECEKLSLARKARRLFHLSDSCATDLSGECSRLWPGYQFPRQAGPVIAFSLGYAGDPKDAGTVPTDPALRNLLRAGLKITFSTVSGIAQTVFRPGTGSGSSSSYPLGATAYDRSVVPGKEEDGYRFYVPFVDSFVLDFSPSQAAASAKILR